MVVDYEHPAPFSPAWGWLRDAATGEPLREATEDEWRRGALATGWGTYDDGERIVQVTGGPALAVYCSQMQIWAGTDWSDHGPLRRMFGEMDTADRIGAAEAGRAAVEMASWLPGGFWRVLVWEGNVPSGDPAAVWVNSSAVTVDDARRILAGVRRDDEWGQWAADEYMAVVDRILSEEAARNATRAMAESLSHWPTPLDTEVADR